MPNQYDKIIRENLEALVLPLLDKFLGIAPEQFETISDELQVTIERKPDLLKRIIMQNGQKATVHIEFQATNEKQLKRCLLPTISLKTSSTKKENSVENSGVSNEENRKKRKIPLPECCDPVSLPSRRLLGLPTYQRPLCSR